MSVLPYVLAPCIFMNFNIITNKDNKNRLPKLYLKIDLSITF